MINETNIQTAYSCAKERYADMGVDTETALKKLAKIEISIQCWQGDDVNGFENPEAALTGGIASTGNYPGKARNADELRLDLAQVLKLLPGKHRVNLHAIYAETGGKKVERNELRPEHYTFWKDWAKSIGIGLDFNPTCFSHPLAADGFTLSHKDSSIRQFWVEHCMMSRKIGEYFGRQLGTACVTNIWVPDGYKDSPFDRKAPRERLQESLDKVFTEKISPAFNLDAVEPKLFGIGSESYVVGSMEFYTGYAIKNNVLLTLDAGHFHPTETISDKISSLLLYIDQLFLHVSRGVRWDSDHVVTLNDDLLAIAQEIIRIDALDRVHVGLDYFDASINRIAAWTIGARNTLKALLFAMLEPRNQLILAETTNNFSQRLALLEENKMMPASAVWDYYCLNHNVPIGIGFMDEIGKYEKTEIAKRL